MLRDWRVIGGVVAVVFILLLSSGLIKTPSRIDLPDIAITGYDGIESTVYEFQHSYTGDNIPDTLTGLGSTVATFDPNIDLNPLYDPNGIHIDIQEPNVLGFEEIDTITKERIENKGGKDYLVTDTWEVQKVKLDLGVHLYTTGNGYDGIEQVRIMIRLVENSYSVFMDADESEAYILNVYTTEQTEQSGGAINQVAPLAEGIDVEIITLTTHDTPQWILDSGYTGELTNFKDIAFPITVVNMQRFSIAGAVISEAQNTMTFGFDVLLFGHWEQWKDYRALVYVFPDFLGDIFLMLMTPLGIALAIVAIIGTMVVLWKAPGYFLKIFGVVAIWLAVFFVLLLFGVVAL